jgi:hypothetical protein
LQLSWLQAVLRCQPVFDAIFMVGFLHSPLTTVRSFEAPYRKETPMRKALSLLLIPLLTLVLTACPASGGGPDTPKVTGVTLNETTLALAVGATGTLTAAVAGDEGVRQDVTWSSDTPAVATVDTGVVTAVAAGTARVTATSTVDTSKTASATVTVTAAGGGSNEPDPDESEFALSVSVSASSVDVPLHSSAELGIEIVRDGGFAGAVEISVNGLTAADLSVQSVTIPAGATTASLLISSHDDSESGFGTASVTVVAEAGSLLDSASVEVNVVPVVTSTEDNGPGTLRALLAAVPAGQATATTITFDPNVFGEATTIIFDDVIRTSSNAAIVGPVASDGKLLLTLDGNGTQRLISPDKPANITLENLILTNASGAQRAGAIDNFGTLLIRNSWLHANQGFAGGAIYNDGTLTVENSTISGNTARKIQFSSGNGAGILNTSSGKLTVVNSTISNNEAFGGLSRGGGISNGGTATIISSTIAYNRTDVDDESLGTPSGGGGGIRSTGTLNIRSSIVAENTAGGDGVGPDLLFTGGNHQSDEFNLIGNTAHSGFLAGAYDQTDMFAHLEGLNDYGGSAPTVSLGLTSPAKNWIPLPQCTDNDGKRLETDQRGRPRPGLHAVDSRCDVGAYETQ